MSEFQQFARLPNSTLPEHNNVYLTVNHRTVPFLETTDFRLDNPWSSFFRSVLTQLRDEARFSGKIVRELGVGDARNLFYLGDDLREVVGIDAHQPALQLATENVAHLPFPVDLYLGDAVAFVKQPGEAWGGVVIACLPQTPIQDSSENKLVGAFHPENPHIASYAAWKASGLQLIAATLGELSKRAKNDLQVLILLSGRIPTSERMEMIHTTGWAVRQTIATDASNIAQQSEDVSVAYTYRYATTSEQLFWEKTTTGMLSPIDPITAEQRRLVSHQASIKEKPNVYYHLYAYVLEPDARETSSLISP